MVRIFYNNTEIQKKKSNNNIINIVIIFHVMRMKIETKINN